MEGKSFFEAINLLVIAENDAFRNTFIGDLKGFLQSEDYKPPPRLGTQSEKTTFSALFRDFSIISSPVLSRSDTPKDISSKLYKFQDHFIRALKLNATIIVMGPDPSCYEHFLSLNLFNNFSKDDTAILEKNVIFVFVHHDPNSFQKRDMVDVNLWTVLDRIGADLYYSKTLHYYSRMDKDFCNTFMQFIYKNKKTVFIETIYLHKSVLKVIENNDFLEKLMDSLFIIVDNIHSIATGQNKQYSIWRWDKYHTVCTNQKCLTKFCCDCSQVNTKSHLGQCDALINESTCTKCNCSINDHKAVKYFKYEIQSGTWTEKQQKKYRNSIINIIVTIDLLQKENNSSVGQLYDILKKRIEQKTHYSVLETLYKHVMDGCKKGITGDDYIKCVRRLLPSLQGFDDVEIELGNALLLAERHLRVRY